MCEVYLELLQLQQAQAAAAVPSSLLGRCASDVHADL